MFHLILITWDSEMKSVVVSTYTPTMNDHVLSQIGKKIRTIRHTHSRTIQEIADRAGVSKGLISKIENGRTVPSLPVLLGIIQALDTEIPHFFEGIEYIQYDGFVHRSKGSYEVVDKEDSVGYTYRAVMEQSFSNFSVNIQILDLEPDAQRELVTTDGYTYLYMLKGKVIFELGDKLVNLSEEDSLFFNGKIPHRPINQMDQPVRIFIVYLLVPHME